MIFKIREASLDDLEALHLISRDSLGYDYPIYEMREKLIKSLDNEKEKIFVATADDMTVGYIHLCDYDLLFAPNFKNVLAIAVLDGYKRLGIGSALLVAGEKWAAQNGAVGVRLCSGEKRTNAHQFYRTCGYESNKKQLNFKKFF